MKPDFESDREVDDSGDDSEDSSVIADEYGRAILFPYILGTYRF